MRGADHIQNSRLSAAVLPEPAHTVLVSDVGRRGPLDELPKNSPLAKRNTRARVVVLPGYLDAAVLTALRERTDRRRKLGYRHVQFTLTHAEELIAFAERALRT